MSPRVEKPGHEIGNVKVIARGPKALLAREENGTEEWWPYSQIHDDSEVWDESPIGEEGKLIVTKWIAQQKEREVEDD